MLEDWTECPLGESLVRRARPLEVIHPSTTIYHADPQLHIQEELLEF